ncbi:MAG TPA: site-2 protease family protein [Anaerolineales bacterium]|nr:site-2 protease family protein [Anaerolineales bacterium]
MKSGFRLGKIFGINIDIDWSWLLIFALVSWSLASSFSLAHPEWTNLMQWGLALTAALLFFASILAHEFAHALAARAMNIPVRNITLFMFGGISNIQKEPRSPFGEFAIAIVGPITSIVLGGVFLALGLGSFAFGNIPLMDSVSALSQVGPMGTMFVWLGSVNILIALFNMIPGFPLDGGRIFRSALWAVTDNLKESTRWASWMGQAVAWILIFAGISMMFGVNIPILGSGFINGVWIMFIGWFLQNAAVQSYRKIVVEDILEDIPVKQMMYTDVPMVKAGASVQTLIDNYIMQTDHRAFVVFDGDRMVGLVTIDDVRKMEPEARDQTVIGSIMTPSEKLIVIAPEEEAANALERLQSGDIRQLPVVTGNKIIGLLRRKDIVRWLQFQSHLG